MSIYPVFYVDDFGPIGSGDDTPAWQGAVDAAKAYNGGHGATVRCDRRDYAVSAINCTGLQGLTVDAPLGAQLYGCNQTMPAAILDFTGSIYCKINNINTVGQQFHNSNPPPVIPLAGILLAESVPGDSGKHKLDTCGSYGKFQSGAICIIGSTDNNFNACGWQQDFLGRPCLNISLLPDWYISSPFKPITQGAGNVGDQTFVGCEFHGFRGPGVGWTTYMRSADNVRFFGGVHDASGSAHMLFQGICTKITSVGQKFYSESGHAPSYIFEAQPSCDNLCVINPNENSNAYSVGRTTGAFPNSRFL